MRRSNFTWFDGAREITPSPDGLSHIRNGCYLRGVSAPSKCDRDNVEWGAKPMWFLVDDQNPLNFASRYLAYERTYPCPVAQRQQWAAFSTKRRAARIRACCVAACSPAGGGRHRCSHVACYQITLACAMFGAVLPNHEALAQALLRWESPASVAIYAMMAPSGYASPIEQSNATGAHPQRYLPDFDPSGRAADLRLAVDQLQRGLRGAGTALA